MSRRTYYKATRPDGTDFFSGIVNYARALETGKELQHPFVRLRDNPVTYFSVATVPTDCTGMQWPCRLFAIHGIGRAMKDSDLPNKRAFSALRVVRELPAWQVFGPQGQEVIAIIERAGLLAGTEIPQPPAANSGWLEKWSAAADLAHVAARHGWREAAWDVAATVTMVSSGELGVGLDIIAAWAACATVVRDLISEEHYRTLMAAWWAVVRSEE